MISLFCATPGLASARAAATLAVLSLIPVIIVHLIPTQAILWMRSGANARRLLTMMPICGLLADWLTKSYASLPDIVHLVIGFILGSTLCILQATIWPPAVTTWASLSALTVLVAGSYWWTSKYFFPNRALTSGTLFIHSVAILGITLLMFILAARFLGVYLAILMPGLDPAQCVTSIALSGFLTMIYMSLTELKISRSRLDDDAVKLYHVQFLSASCALVTIIMMLIEKLDGIF